MSGASGNGAVPPPGAVEYGGPGYRDANGLPVGSTDSNGYIGIPLPLAEVNVPDRIEAATPESAAPAASARPNAQPASLPPQDNTLYLVVNGSQYTAWLSASITRGIEIMPASATFELTERYPGDPARADIKAGDPCTVLIGATLMLTGYVSRRRTKIGRDGVRITIMVRSLSQDLVECAVDPAQVPNMQISQGTPLQIANALAGNYGVPVRQLGSAKLDTIKQFNVGIGRTPYDVIEEIARYAALLVYDDTDGAVILAQNDSMGAMASGFTEGVNVEAAEAIDAMDARFSDIEVYYTSSYSFSDIAPMQPAAKAPDPKVPRFRKHIVISEQAAMGQDIASARAKWEVARRYGRSQPVILTTDSWRDASGALWALNMEVPLSLPRLKIDKTKWIIAQVTFRRGADGTHADLVLMPPQAFAPEPNIQFPFDLETYQTLQAGGGSAQPGGPSPAPPAPAQPPSLSGASSGLTRRGDL